MEWEYYFFLGSNKEIWIMKVVFSEFWRVGKIWFYRNNNNGSNYLLSFYYKLIIVGLDYEIDFCVS